MALTIIAIGGEPATGKTTVIRRLMKATGGELAWLMLKEKLVVYHSHDALKTHILGDYGARAGLFGGTDKLSMAVQTQIIRVLTGWEQAGVRRVLFEGDRLYKPSFFRSAAEAGFRLRLYELRAGEGVLGRRHKGRGDGQKEAWLAGRRTGLANVRKDWDVETRPNSTEEELEDNVAFFKGLIDRKGIYP